MGRAQEEIEQSMIGDKERKVLKKHPGKQKSFLDVSASMDIILRA